MIQQVNKTLWELPSLVQTAWSRITFCLRETGAGLSSPFSPACPVRGTYVVWPPVHLLHIKQFWGPYSLGPALRHPDRGRRRSWGRGHQNASVGMWSVGVSMTPRSTYGNLIGRDYLPWPLRRNRVMPPARAWCNYSGRVDLIVNVLINGRVICATRGGCVFFRELLVTWPCGADVQEYVWGWRALFLVQSILLPHSIGPVGVRPAIGSSHAVLAGVVVMEHAQTVSRPTHRAAHPLTTRRLLRTRQRNNWLRFQWVNQ